MHKDSVTYTDSFFECHHRLIEVGSSLVEEANYYGAYYGT